MSFVHPETTLVLGGTGKTGRRVAQRLCARGLPVRIASRSGTPPFDWSRPDTWRAAVDGVRSMYLTYQPDLAVPGAAEQIRDLTRLAVASGTRRIVILSGRGEEHALAGEQAVRESGAAFTVLRAAWFAQNFSEGLLLPAVLAGEIALPGGSVTEPFVDVEDIADVAMLALTDDAHDGATYELTGPRLLSFADAAAEIASVSRRSVHYRHVSPAEYVAILGEHVPEDEASFLTELFTRVLDGRNAHVSPDVSRLLGRGARDFKAYASAAAATGVWA